MNGDVRTRIQIGAAGSHVRAHPFTATSRDPSTQRYDDSRHYFSSGHLSSMGSDLRVRVMATDLQTGREAVVYRSFRAPREIQDPSAMMQLPEHSFAVLDSQAYICPKPKGFTHSESLPPLGRKSHPDRRSRSPDSCRPEQTPRFSLSTHVSCLPVLARLPLNEGLLSRSRAVTVCRSNHLTISSVLCHCPPVPPVPLVSYFVTILVPHIKEGEKEAWDTLADRDKPFSVHTGLVGVPLSDFLCVGLCHVVFCAPPTHVASLFDALDWTE